MTVESKAAAKGAKVVAKKAQRLERLKVEYVDTMSIAPNDYNPNRQSEKDFQLLLRSMTEDGFTQPIVVQRDTTTIVDGEHRWRAAQHLGLKQVPVVFVDMTVEQMRISTLRHNRARGSEDQDLVAAVLRDLRELGALEWAQDSLMLDDKELDRMIEMVPAAEALAGTDWGEAWAPTQDTSGTDETGAGGAFETEYSPTPGAKARMEGHGAALRSASPDQSMALEAGLRQDILRLSFVFNGEEAEIVRSALGDNAAVRLLELCRYEEEPA